VKNAAGSDGKWLDVSAERLPGWIASFSVRHGVSGAGEAAGEALAVALVDGHVSFTAPDGSVAQCHPPFPPAGGLAALIEGAVPLDVEDPAAIAEALAAHARRPRTVGVLLVRLGGYAAGVFTGYPPVLQDAKVGSRLVHGRSAAGGWSQHRFARRREKQVNEALTAAADAAVMIFGRGGMGGKKETATARSKNLDAVVLGGDRRAVAELRDDQRLAPYFKLAAERFLTVPDPKRAVLLETPRQFTAVRIRLTET
jgi:hypothetical protein